MSLAEGRDEVRSEPGRRYIFWVSFRVRRDLSVVLSRGTEGSSHRSTPQDRVRLRVYATGTDKPPLGLLITDVVVTVQPTTFTNSHHRREGPGRYTRAYTNR